MKTSKGLHTTPEKHHRKTSMNVYNGSERHNTNGHGLSKTTMANKSFVIYEYIS